MLKTINNLKALHSTYLSTRNLQQSKTKWDLLTAVCVERKPIVTPALTELEQTFHKYLSEKEFELSLKSDHELQHEAELKQQSLLKKGDVDLDATTKQTAQDFLDACTEELAQFKFADRLTGFRGIVQVYFKFGILQMQIGLII
uniref:Large ribosomal subunit protein mL46 N-terminal domain-containing protein n=1 Tax=Photinus pyralis TaxID=7054 RepID=A0A1Y1L4T3_PHOPY